MLGFPEVLEGLNVLLIALFVFAGIGLWTTVRFVRDLVIRGLRRHRGEVPHYVKADRSSAREEELSYALRRIEHLENQLEFTDGLFRG